MSAGQIFVRRRRSTRKSIIRTRLRAAHKAIGIIQVRITKLAEDKVEDTPTTKAFGQALYAKARVAVEGDEQVEMNEAVS